MRKSLAILGGAVLLGGLSGCGGGGTGQEICVGIVHLTGSGAGGPESAKGSAADGSGRGTTPPSLPGAQ